MALTRMSDADAAWLGMDAPDNLMMVTGVLRLQGRVDWLRFADVVEQRMLAPYPAFRRKALPATSPFEQPVWSDDPDFALSADGTRYISKASHTPTTIPEPGLPFSLVFRAEPGRSSPRGETASPITSIVPTERRSAACRSARCCTLRSRLR